MMGRTAQQLTERRASNQVVCTGTLFRKRFYTFRTKGRVGWVVSAAVDALGGSVRAYAGSLLRQRWFCEALEAEVSSGCVRLIAAGATALSAGGAFWAASSWVAEFPAEGALSSGGGRPHRPDRADAVEE